MANASIHRSGCSLLFLLMFLMSSTRALTLCPTAVWDSNVTVVAGAANRRSGSTASTLRSPTDLAVLNNSVVYILDAGNYRVQRVFANSTLATSIVNSSNGMSLNQFASMNAMSVLDNGDILILDGDNGRVVKWTPGGSSGVLMAGGNGNGSRTDQIASAKGMFVELNTLIIWIADTSNHRIVKWSSPTASTIVCGSYGVNADQFKYPVGLFVDTNDADTLYVADTGNHRVQAWRSGASQGVTVAGLTSFYGDTLYQLFAPQAVLVDTDRNMFIIDTYNVRLMKWKVGASAGVVLVTKPFDGYFAPTAFAFDPSGSMFVVESHGNRVVKLRSSCPPVSNTSSTTAMPVTTSAPDMSNGCAKTIWASNGTTILGSPIGLVLYDDVETLYPQDIAIGADDSLYVLNQGEGRIDRFPPGSTVGTPLFYANSTFGLNNTVWLRAMSIGIDGSIYVTDIANGAAIKWVPTAMTATVVAGGNGDGSNPNQLSYPEAIFVPYNSTVVWIADTYNQRIVKWETPIIGVIVAGGEYGSDADQFAFPQGLFVDVSTGNTLYVADTDNNRIQLWLPDATEGTTVAGQTGVCGDQLNQLCYPVAITLDRQNDMYIADVSNSRIVRWTLGASSGVVVAGNAGRGSLPYQFCSPWVVRFTSDGALIVADLQNYRVQKFPVVCGPARTTAAAAQTTTVVASTTRAAGVVTTSSSVDSTRVSTVMAQPASSNGMRLPSGWLFVLLCSAFAPMYN